MPSNPAVRLVQFSDIHITTEPLGWTSADWFNKRLPGWLNLKFLGRKHRFREADVVLAALADELQRRRPDHVIFSGDATALGFEAELVHALRLLDLSGPNDLPGLAVPGNHDYYTRPVAASGLFERFFAPWQKGERVGDAVYPFAQRVGHVWLVAVNSAKGNRWFWDATGSVGPEQLGRLEILLSRLDPGPRILVTHYPVCLANGEPERHFHRLCDLADLVAVAVRGGVSLWLHGHRHGPYYRQGSSLAPFPVVCAGSATEAGDWSYGEYTIEGNDFHGLRRVFCPERGSFRDEDVFAFRLGG